MHPQVKLRDEVKKDIMSKMTELRRKYYAVKPPLRTWNDECT